MSLLKGKKGLIMGVANDRSIAWGIAKKLSEKTSQPWYSITSKVEQVTAEIMKKTKGVEIFPNVDLTVHQSITC